MTEGYLRIKIKNAQNAAGRYEQKVADLRIEMARYVDLYLIETNEAAFLDCLLKEMCDGKLR